MVATAIYSVTMVLWKETAFPLCRAMEKRYYYYYYYYLFDTHKSTDTSNSKTLPVRKYTNVKQELKR